MAPSSPTPPQRRDRIRFLNDAFRTQGPVQEGWVLTVGIQSLGLSAIRAAIAAVVQFDQFTPDNDPHQEHDFGAFELQGQRAYWKIDYYDVDLRFASSDPSDESLTRRILTILLASEY